MIKVLRSGLYSSIQDLGRFNYRKYGVPVSGAMDSFAAKRANSLLQNVPEAAVLEIMMLGPKLKFLVNTNIVITGGQGNMTINDQPVSINRVITIAKEDILDIGRITIGAYVYLAVLGGFDSEIIYGSRSYFSGVGLPNIIKKGDLLPITEGGGIAINHNAKIRSLPLQGKEIEVFQGPEYHKLSAPQKQLLLTKEFTIGPHNRMGYYLNEKISHQIEGILTGPVIPGTVQLTPSGTMIILMNDAQTTGGYPRILVLSEAARYRLSQKKSQQPIKFTLLCQKNEE